MKCAFIGLGVMGYPMAGCLVKAGHEVAVYNRTHAKAKKWAAEYGGTAAKTPAEASQDADFIAICVGNDDDLRSVMIGEEAILATAKAGAIIVDHTTVSAKISRELYGICQEKQIDFLDAPVSGGQVGAEKGQLTIMVGGQETAFQKAEPVMQAYALKVGYMGETGAGQLTKMVNQICIAGLVQALSEGMNFAQNAGLDVPKLLEILTKGAAGSWQMANRGETMASGEFEFGFAVDWMRKDLGLCLAEAQANGSHLPVTALVDEFYAQIQQKGGNRWDTSSLITLLTDKK